VFDTVLIANRGEIACRILRTLRRLGVRGVAVHSDTDADAAHVAAADAAVAIGPAPAAESYLNVAAIVAAAKKSGVQAVHPGYGFLAENADFAEACRAAGLVFVGPPPAAIRALGDKSAAKALMAEAGVPLVPGYHGAAQNPARLAQAAEDLGFPVLVKAAAGGGGRGLRVVARREDLPEALAAARREAEAAFGDGRLLVEKYLERPRHIEVQVFADTLGNAVHLYERDCSLQRRHQKVIEESPAPGLPADARAAMGGAALAAARAAGYVGAGTVEFLWDGRGFYFLEMNTRLQVEHPVTEMVTGFDLVEWQLRVAAGEALPARQDDIAPRGHAIEVRLYAEDPERDFLPGTGRLLRLRLPPENAHLRIDSGVREGDMVSSHYDPLLAKLIVWDRDRDAAVRRLRNALAEVVIAGPANNVGFLSAVAAHRAFAAARVDTGFLARHRDELLPDRGAADDETLALAALAELLRRRDLARAAAHRSADPHSLWQATDGWRLNAPAESYLRLADGLRSIAVVARESAGGFELRLPGDRRIAVCGELDGTGDLGGNLAGHFVGDLTGEVDGRAVTAVVVRHGQELILHGGGRVHRLKIVDPLHAAAAEEGHVGHMAAPMPGKIVAVKVAPGQTVERGTLLIVMEAMKMEHGITAPASGTVAAVKVAAGDLVNEGAELITFEEETGAGAS
jgi:3-methylcrotonyl-CoA carboxylase alpha subunit